MNRSVREIISYLKENYEPKRMLASELCVSENEIIIEINETELSNIVKMINPDIFNLNIIHCLSDNKMSNIIHNDFEPDWRTGDSDEDQWKSHIQSYQNIFLISIHKISK